MPLGLNWTINSAAAESGTDTYEPETPRSRETLNALTATTTIDTQARPISTGQCGPNVAGARDLVR